jgi:hypothetical protein
VGSPSLDTPSPAEETRAVFETLTLLGIVCVIGAIVGGGLKAAGAEIPVITSGRRQVLLGAVGVVLVVAALVTHSHMPASTPEVTSSSQNPSPTTTVKLVRGGLTLATVVLRYSPVSETTWGVVRGLGSKEKLRLVVLESDHGTPSYARLTHSDSKGDRFFQAHGCVRSIAVTEYDGKTLARTRTRCL